MRRCILISTRQNKDDNTGDDNTGDNTDDILNNLTDITTTSLTVKASYNHSSNARVKTKDLETADQYDQRIDDVIDSAGRRIRQ